MPEDNTIFVQIVADGEPVQAAMKQMLADVKGALQTLEAEAKKTSAVLTAMAPGEPQRAAFRDYANVVKVQIADIEKQLDDYNNKWDELRSRIGSSLDAFAKYERAATTGRGPYQTEEKTYRPGQILPRKVVTEAREGLAEARQDLEIAKPEMEALAASGFAFREKVLATAQAPGRADIGIGLPKALLGPSKEDRAKEAEERAKAAAEAAAKEEEESAARAKRDAEFFASYKAAKEKAASLEPAPVAAPSEAAAPPIPPVAPPPPIAAAPPPTPPTPPVVAAAPPPPPPDDPLTRQREKVELLKRSYAEKNADVLRYSQEEVIAQKATGQSVEELKLKQEQLNYQTKEQETVVRDHVASLNEFIETNKKKATFGEQAAGIADKERQLLSQQIEKRDQLKVRQEQNAQALERELALLGKEAHSDEFARTIDQRAQIGAELEKEQAHLGLLERSYALAAEEDARATGEKVTGEGQKQSAVRQTAAVEAEATKAATSSVSDLQLKGAQLAAEQRQVAQDITAAQRQQAAASKANADSAGELGAKQHELRTRISETGASIKQLTSDSEAWRERAAAGDADAEGHQARIQQRLGELHTARANDLTQLDEVRKQLVANKAAEVEANNPAPVDALIRKYNELTEKLRQNKAELATATTLAHIAGGAPPPPTGGGGAPPTSGGGGGEEDALLRQRQELTALRKLRAELASESNRYATDEQVATRATGQAVNELRTQREVLLAGYRDAEHSVRQLADAAFQMGANEKGAASATVAGLEVATERSNLYKIAVQNIDQALAEEQAREDAAAHKDRYAEVTTQLKQVDAKIKESTQNLELMERTVAALGQDSKTSADAAIAGEAAKQSAVRDTTAAQTDGAATAADAQTAGAARTMSALDEEQLKLFLLSREQARVGQEARRVEQEQTTARSASGEQIEALRAKQEILKAQLGSVSQEYKKLAADTALWKQASDQGSASAKQNVDQLTSKMEALLAKEAEYQAELKRTNELLKAEEAAFAQANNPAQIEPLIARISELNAQITKTKERIGELQPVTEQIGSSAGAGMGKARVLMAALTDQTNAAIYGFTRLIASIPGLAAAVEAAFAFAAPIAAYEIISSLVSGVYKLYENYVLLKHAEEETAAVSDRLQKAFRTEWERTEELLAAQAEYRGNLVEAAKIRSNIAATKPIDLRDFLKPEEIDEKFKDLPRRFQDQLKEAFRVGPEKFDLVGPNVVTKLNDFKKNLADVQVEIKKATDAQTALVASQKELFKGQGSSRGEAAAAVGIQIYEQERLQRLYELLAKIYTQAIQEIAQKRDTDAAQAVDAADKLEQATLRELIRGTTEKVDALKTRHQYTVAAEIALWQDVLAQAEKGGGRHTALYEQVYGKLAALAKRGTREILDEMKQADQQALADLEEQQELTLEQKKKFLESRKSPEPAPPVLGAHRQPGEAAPAPLPIGPAGPPAAPLPPKALQYQGLVGEATAKYGLPPNLLNNLIGAESGWDEHALSLRGAQGLTQLMPGTAAELGVNPLDPKGAIEGGAKYLHDRFVEFGDWTKALQAYNAGAGAVRAAEAHHTPLRPETQDYVAKISTGTTALAGTAAAVSALTEATRKHNAELKHQIGLVDQQIYRQEAEKTLAGHRERIEGITTEEGRPDYTKQLDAWKEVLAQARALRATQPGLAEHLETGAEKEVGRLAPEADRQQQRERVDDARRAFKEYDAEEKRSTANELLYWETIVKQAKAGSLLYNVALDEVAQYTKKLNDENYRNGQQDLINQHEIAQAKFDIRRAEIESDYAMSEQTYRDKVHELERIKALDKELLKEEQDYWDKRIAFARSHGEEREESKLGAEKTAAGRRANEVLLKDNLKLTEEMEKQWQKVFNFIDQQFISAFNSWLTGHQKFSAAMVKMWNQIVQHVEDALLQLVLKFAEHELKILLQHVLTNKAKTADDDMTAATSLAISKEKTIKDIFMDAKGAAATAFRQAMKLPPPINFILAPILAAAAFVGVMAFAAFEKGGIVPNTGLAMVHGGEGVLPQPLTSMLTSVATNYNTNTSTGGNSHVHVHYSPTIQGAGGGGDMRMMLSQHADHIGRIVQRQLKTFNR
jgi:soluble lytic murein transglycosylase-like protein